MLRPIKILVCGAAIFGCVSVQTGVAEERPEANNRHQEILERVRNHHIQFSSTDCYPERSFADDRAIGDEIYQLEPTTGANQDESGSPGFLARMYCGSGAYNAWQYWYYLNEELEIKPLSFADPQLDIEYVDPENSESQVENITVTGFGTDGILQNSDFDPTSNLIINLDLWRGLGDAQAFGYWRFEDERPVLIEYNVDASFDGNYNPVMVYSAHGVDKWDTYTNSRFGTQVEVPIAKFEPQPGPSNGDGRTWKSEDGKGEIRVFGNLLKSTNEGFDEAVSERMALAEEDGWKISYEASGGDWYVFSGSTEDMIFYHRMQLTSYCDTEIIHHLRLEYPRHQKGAYEAMASRMSLSLLGTTNSIYCSE